MKLFNVWSFLAFLFITIAITSCNTEQNDVLDEMEKGGVINQTQESADVKTKAYSKQGLILDLLYENDAFPTRFFREFDLDDFAGVLFIDPTGTLPSREVTHIRLKNTLPNKRMQIEFVPERGGARLYAEVEPGEVAEIPYERIAKYLTTTSSIDYLNIRLRP